MITQLSFLSGESEGIATDMIQAVSELTGFEGEAAEAVRARFSEQYTEIRAELIEVRQGIFQKFDCYSPETKNVRNIWKTVVGKTETQASRIVVNLDDYTGTIDDLIQQFESYPIDGLDELFFIKDNTIIRVR